VLVSLAADPESLTLRVEDDGRGMGDVAAGPESLGILGMKERAQMLGGDVAFARRGERGTVVTLRVPLARVAETGAGA
jgi:signal transduction histidine kinase